MPRNDARRQRELERILAGLTTGKSDTDIRAELDLTPTRYAQLKRELLDAEVERIKTLTTEHVYVEYCLAQQGCIRDINAVLEVATKGKNTNAAVGAVRARSDIIDKMIKLGQDFGILEKKPQEKRIIAGVVVAQMSNEQLKAAITSQISNLNELVTKYGDRSFTELEAGDLYRDVPDTDTIDSETLPTDKTNRAKRSQVYKGRRVVKQPVR